MASVTHMGVAATDHVVLYALRNIAGGCVQAGYEFFRANVGGLGSAPNPDPGGTSAGLQEVIVRGYLVAARR
jgi:hypothetical protein